MQGIYKVENLINGNCYVGQSVDITTRWNDHMWVANKEYRHEYEYPLYRAIRKYGIDNFGFEILEEVYSKDDLTSRELYWYEKLKPEYNQMKPTESSSYKRPVFAIDMNTLKISKRYDSLKQAAEDTRTSSGNIHKALNGDVIHLKGFYWCYEENYDSWKPRKSKRGNGKPVIKIDLETDEELEYFETITDAAKSVNTNASSILYVCEGKNKTSKGFKWKYR